MKRPLYNAIHSLFHKPSHFVSALCVRLSFLFPDKLYLKLMYRLELGKRLDLDHPVTYNEKLQWLKLYYHRPEMVTMADKWAVMHTVVSRRVGVKRFDPEEITQYYYQFTDRYLNDLTQNAIVFILKPYTAPGA